MAESLSLARVRAVPAASPAPTALARAARPRRRTRVWIDRLAVAIIVAAPAAALLCAWLGLMPPRAEAVPAVPAVARQAGLANVE